MLFKFGRVLPLLRKKKNKYNAYRKINSRKIFSYFYLRKKVDNLKKNIKNFKFRYSQELNYKRKRFTFLKRGASVKIAKKSKIKRFTQLKFIHLNKFRQYTNFSFSVIFSNIIAISNLVAYLEQNFYSFFFMRAFQTKKYLVRSKKKKLNFGLFYAYNKLRDIIRNLKKCKRNFLSLFINKKGRLLLVNIKYQFLTFFSKSVLSAVFHRLHNFFFMISASQFCCVYFKNFFYLSSFLFSILLKKCLSLFVFLCEHLAVFSTYLMSYNNFFLFYKFFFFILLVHRVFVVQCKNFFSLNRARMLVSLFLLSAYNSFSFSSIVHNINYLSAQYSWREKSQNIFFSVAHAFNKEFLMLHICFLKHRAKVFNPVFAMLNKNLFLIKILRASAIFFKNFYFFKNKFLFNFNLNVFLEVITIDLWHKQKLTMYPFFSNICRDFEHFMIDFYFFFRSRSFLFFKKNEHVNLRSALLNYSLLVHNFWIFFKAFIYAWKFFKFFGGVFLFFSVGSFNLFFFYKNLNISLDNFLIFKMQCVLFLVNSTYFISFVFHFFLLDVVTRTAIRLFSTILPILRNYCLFIFKDMHYSTLLHMLKAKSFVFLSCINNFQLLSFFAFPIISFSLFQQCESVVESLIMRDLLILLNLSWFVKLESSEDLSDSDWASFFVRHPLTYHQYLNLEVSTLLHLDKTLNILQVQKSFSENYPKFKAKKHNNKQFLKKLKKNLFLKKELQKVYRRSPLFVGFLTTMRSSLKYYYSQNLCQIHKNGWWFSNLFFYQLESECIRLLLRFIQGQSVCFDGFLILGRFYTKKVKCIFKYMQLLLWLRFLRGVFFFKGLLKYTKTSSNNLLFYSYFAMRKDITKKAIFCKVNAKFKSKRLFSGYFLTKRSRIFYSRYCSKKTFMSLRYMKNFDFYVARDKIRLRLSCNATDTAFIYYNMSNFRFISRLLVLDILAHLIKVEFLKTSAMPLFVGRQRGLLSYRYMLLQRYRHLFLSFLSVRNFDVFYLSNSFMNLFDNYLKLGVYSFTFFVAYDFDRIFIESHKVGKVSYNFIFIRFPFYSINAIYLFLSLKIIKFLNPSSMPNSIFSTFFNQRSSELIKHRHAIFRVFYFHQLRQNQNFVLQIFMNLKQILGVYTRNTAFFWINFVPTLKHGFFYSLLRLNQLFFRVLYFLSISRFYLLQSTLNIYNIHKNFFLKKFSNKSICVFSRFSFFNILHTSGLLIFFRIFNDLYSNKIHQFIKFCILRINWLQLLLQRRLQWYLNTFINSIITFSFFVKNTQLSILALAWQRVHYIKKFLFLLLKRKIIMHVMCVFVIISFFNVIFYRFEECLNLLFKLFLELKFSQFYFNRLCKTILTGLSLSSVLLKRKELLQFYNAKVHSRHLNGSYFCSIKPKISSYDNMQSNFTVYAQRRHRVHYVLINNTENSNDNASYSITIFSVILGLAFSVFLTLKISKKRNRRRFHNLIPKDSINLAPLLQITLSKTSLTSFILRFNYFNHYLLKYYKAKRHSLQQLQSLLRYPKISSLFFVKYTAYLRNLQCKKYSTIPLAFKPIFASSNMYSQSKGLNRACTFLFYKRYSIIKNRVFSAFFAKIKAIAKFKLKDKVLLEQIKSVKLKRYCYLNFYLQLRKTFSMFSIFSSKLLPLFKNQIYKQSFKVGVKTCNFFLLTKYRHILYNRHSTFVYFDTLKQRSFVKNLYQRSLKKKKKRILLNFSFFANKNSSKIAFKLKHGCLKLLNSKRFVAKEKMNKVHAQQHNSQIHFFNLVAKGKAKDVQKRKNFSVIYNLCQLNKEIKKNKFQFAVNNKSLPFFYSFNIKIKKLNALSTFKKKSFMMQQRKNKNFIILILKNKSQFSKRYKNRAQFLRLFFNLRKKNINFFLRFKAKEDFLYQHLQTFKLYDAFYINKSYGLFFKNSSAIFRKKIYKKISYMNMRVLPKAFISIKKKIIDIAKFKIFKNKSQILYKQQRLFSFFFKTASYVLKKRSLFWLLRFKKLGCISSLFKNRVPWVSRFYLRYRSSNFFKFKHKIIDINLCQYFQPSLSFFKNLEFAFTKRRILLLRSIRSFRNLHFFSYSKNASIVALLNDRLRFSMRKQSILRGSNLMNSSFSFVPSARFEAKFAQFKRSLLYVQYSEKMPMFAYLKFQHFCVKYQLFFYFFKNLFMYFQHLFKNTRIFVKLSILNILQRYFLYLWFFYRKSISFCFRRDQIKFFYALINVKFFRKFYIVFKNNYNKHFSQLLGSIFFKR